MFGDSVVYYVVYKSLRIHFFVNYFYAEVYTLEVHELNTGLHNCAFDHTPH